MKSLIIAILAIVAIGVVVVMLGPSQPKTEQLAIPDATGYVNDYAEIISDETQAKLEEDLKSFIPEIAVLTVKDMQGLTIEEYGIKVAEKWKVGDEDKDDGVILIIATGERKVRIEVGYGSEAKINDAKAGRILDENVVPHLKNGDWEGGILEGVLKIKEALK